MPTPKTLLVLSGPTASGKTALALRLALHFETEIISADSRQFYIEIPIGTAAPAADELKRVHHHFVGNLSIHENMDVAVYEKQVLVKLSQLFEKHDLVVLCGGSGLYIDAVCEGLDVIPDTSEETRAEVDKIYREGGIIALQNKVQAIDPAFFAVTDIQNPRRLQRALEVWMQTGQPFSTFRNRKIAERDFKVVRIALQTDRKQLIENINRRTEQMMASGLLDEARKMLPYRHLNALNTVGYKELFDHFDGKCSHAEAIEKIKINTRRYAKRQMTWLRKNPAWYWFSAEDHESILSFVSRQSIE